MEVLAKAAVAEITKLVEDSSAELRLEISRNQYENVELRRKLSRTESELVLARGCREIKGPEKSSVKGSGLHGPIQICDGVDKGPSGFCVTEMRRPTEHQHRETCSENRDTQPILTEFTVELTGLHRYRCNNEEELEVKGDGVGEPPTQMLGKAESEYSVKLQNSRDGEHVFKRASIPRASPMQDYADLEADNLCCANVSGDQQWLSGQSEPDLIQAADSSGNSMTCLGSLDVQLHIGTLACVKEEAEIKTICIEETESDRVQQQERETLNSMKNEDQAFQPRPQRLEASEEGMRGSQSMVESSSDTEDTLIFQITDSIEPHHRTDAADSANTHSGLGFTHLNRVHDQIHPGKKAFRCTQCGRSFTHRNNLSRHRRIHTGEKPFVCTHCGKRFTQQNHLQEHERIHTKERPFTCAVCGNSFTQQSNLRRHQRIHTGERPYSCIHCPETFTHLTYFKMHQQVHLGGKPQFF